MKKVIFLTPILLIILGAGCTNNTIVEEQQKQIEYLSSQLTSTTKQVEELTKEKTKTETEKQVETVKYIPQSPPTVQTKTENAEIKIERCKSEARLHSENNNKDYTEKEINDNIKACNRESIPIDARMECANKIIDIMNTNIDEHKQNLYEEYYSDCLLK